MARAGARSACPARVSASSRSGSSISPRRSPGTARARRTRPGRSRSIRTCVLLDDDLYSGKPKGGPSYPTASRFFGDTLIYYARATSKPTDPHVGPGLRLASGLGVRQAGQRHQRRVLCGGYARSQAIYCLENLTPPEAEVLQVDISAGTVTTGTKIVSKVTPFRGANGDSQWGLEFTDDGEYFAYSTGGVDTSEPETLHVMKTAGDRHPRRRQDRRHAISRWTIYGKGANRKWVYLNDFNYNIAGAPSGTLSVRDFPIGTTEKVLKSTLIAGGSAHRRRLVRAGASTRRKSMRGLAFVQNVATDKGTFKYLRDLNGSMDDPKNVFEYPAQIAGGTPFFSPDLRYSYFAKNVATDVPTGDSYIMTMATDPRRRSAPSRASCSRRCSAALPAQRGDGVLDGRLQHGHRLGRGLVGRDRRLPGKRGSSQAASTTGSSTATRGCSTRTTGRPGGHAPLHQHPGRELARTTPVEIQQQSERIYGILPNFEGVVFNVLGGFEATDGLYYYKLPFTPTSGGGADGGAPAADAGKKDSK